MSMLRCLFVPVGEGLDPWIAARLHQPAKLTKAASQ
jgi:hypothetical protein